MATLPVILSGKQLGFVPFRLALRESSVLFYWLAEFVSRFGQLKFPEKVRPWPT
jgi:hypothetical protein